MFIDSKTTVLLAGRRFHPTEVQETNPVYTGTVERECQLQSVHGQHPPGDNGESDPVSEQSVQDHQAGQTPVTHLLLRH